MKYTLERKPTSETNKYTGEERKVNGNRRVKGLTNNVYTPIPESSVQKLEGLQGFQH